MRLYHCSPSHNDESIRSQGILTSYSRLARQRIYLVERDFVEWAVGHIRDRYDTQRVTVWIANVNRRSAKQVFHRFWYVERSVSPPCLVGRLVVTADNESYF